MDVRVGVGHGGHAGAEKLVLGIGGDNAGSTLDVELDLVGAREDIQRALDGVGIEVVAQVEQGN